MGQLESMIQKDRAYIVGLGEIGFDYYHLSSEESLAKEQKIRQKYWFEAQAELAMKYQLPVVIHTRNCPEITLDALKNSHVQKFVIHCFSEDWNFAEKILSLSPQARISFTGILTYGKSLQVQEVAKKLPLERIMIETDAPYLLPEPLR